MLQRPQDETGSTFELLPAIDLRGGLVVRLAEGDFARETAYDTDPAELAQAFEASGARWIHIVDLDGARDGARRQTETVARIVAAVGDGVRCEVAGGLRDEEAVAAVLDAGAARAVVGTAALRDPELVGRLIERFGAERVVIALDVRNGLAVGQGWVPGAAGIVVDDVLANLSARGARTFIVTAIERDGLLSGPNVELLGRLVDRGLGEIVASAGIASFGDILAVRAIGCVGAVVGRAIYEGSLNLADAIRLIRGG